MTRPEDLVIPPPRPDRPPLKVNLLNYMQKANTTLAPLFPYLHPGAIITGGSLFMAGPEQDYGQFYHHNSVDEIIVAFVARDATLQTGQLYTGGRAHGVNGFMKDQAKEGAFALFTVTQRQLEQGPQPEALTLLCEGCRKELYRFEWDGASPPGAHELEHPFVGAAGLAEPILRYNEELERRTCDECGHEHEPFPLDAWGWDRYRLQSRAMAWAKAMLLDAAASVGE